MLLCIFVGCETRTDADKAQEKATAISMSESHRQVGMPKITNFQEKRVAKAVMEECDREDLICYAYLYNAFKGQLVFIGRCQGYGVPYSVQYTNPERPLRPDYADTATIPQPDPSGLFKPQGLSATWLMMIDKDGKSRPVYIEPSIIVSPFPLH